MSLKKNLQKEIKERPDSWVLFFDEARFGTHSKIGHGWFVKGERTRVRVKIGFKNFYVYSAVNPKTGLDYSLFLPNVNSINMNQYLSFLSEELRGQEIILVMDGAAWHKSRELKVPKNVKLMYLPPYSPELNPVEKLWQLMKAKVIRNKVYEKLEDLENNVADYIKSLTPDNIKLTCSFNHCLS